MGPKRTNIFMHRNAASLLLKTLISVSLVIILTCSTVTTLNSPVHDTAADQESGGYVASSYQSGVALVNHTSNLEEQDELIKPSKPIGLSSSGSTTHTTNKQTGRVSSGQSKPKPEHHQPRRHNDARRRNNESFSLDCVAKRAEIMRKLQRDQAAGVSPRNGQLDQIGLSSLVAPAGFQKLRPRHEVTSPRGQFAANRAALNASIIDASSSRAETSNVENEHVPECTREGKFEPIQCHKIGYCWCVNKYGQAIKNSASLAGERPYCDTTMYESESNDVLVVTGIRAQRIKALLKAGSSSSSSSSSSTESSSSGTANHGQTSTSTPVHQQTSGNSNATYATGHLEFNGAEGDAQSALSQPEGSSNRSKEQENAEFSRRVNNSQEPALALVPYECSMSRAHARERASKHTDDSIWIPECDSENKRLYADKQCHKGRVCWCVDQISGLPLRTSEQLTMQTTLNCTTTTTAARRSPDSITATGTTALVAKTTLQATIRGQPLSSSSGSPASNSDMSSLTNTDQARNTQHAGVSYYTGFSELCNADKRAEFVVFLINQFRQQLTEFIKLNPSGPFPDWLATSGPTGVPGDGSSGPIVPHRLNEAQVSRWKFATMDIDHDEKLSDREWTKFKATFKLVDKLDDYSLAHKSDHGALILSGASFVWSSPLNILRSQRRCWRDFLQYCGNGDLFTNESIGLGKWLNCTELPSISNPIQTIRDKMMRGVPASPSTASSTAPATAAATSSINQQNSPLAANLNSADNIYANSKEAALARSKKRNPFLGILKPD